jgi:uncharacterized membrane protein (DUF2068 family)
MAARHDRGLRVIAVFKLVKAAALAVLGFASLRLIHRNVADAIAGWVMAIHVDPDNRFVNALLARVSGVDDRKLSAIGAGMFVYAAVMLVEGIGLFLEKRWAEYLTIVVTASLVPLEIYELVQRLTPLRVAALIVNLAIVAYLVRAIAAAKSSSASRSC